MGRATVNNVCKDIQARIDWLDDKIDPKRGPCSAMGRERRSMQRALELIERYEDMRDFIEENDLKQDFYRWLDEE